MGSQNLFNRQSRDSARETFAEFLKPGSTSAAYNNRLRTSGGGFGNDSTRASMESAGVALRNAKMLHEKVVL
jgi:hypothetical protein